MVAVAEKIEEKLLKLDLGCGKNKRAGYVGVDNRSFEGVDVVCNLAERVKFPNSADPLKPHESFKPWPWDDSSIETVHSAHFIEHLNAAERIHFVNELWRVLVPGGQATLITPYWASMRAYGDLTHQWPPVSEMWFSYLDKTWRESQTPHCDQYTCDFTTTWGYGFHQSLNGRNPEYVSYALNWYKEAAQDLHATLTARK